MDSNAGRHPWGPFIKPTFIVQPILRSDLIVGGAMFALSNILGLIAASRAVLQYRAARTPARSVYIWMLWIEICVSLTIAYQCQLYLLKLIPPSFYFYISILFLWSIQVQIILQIIINRVRVILTDHRKGRRIMITVAFQVTCINITVFCIWMPARLQISKRWISVNNVWDRMEKIIFLLIDATLNWYFIYVVRTNLIENGLKKYKAVLRFNEGIIIVSLLTDVAIIAAMSIPNGFVYVAFHPVAYLVKLNIEMTMANLIRKVAFDNQGQRNIEAGSDDRSEDRSNKVNIDAPSPPSSTSRLQLQHLYRGEAESASRAKPRESNGQIMRTAEYRVESEYRFSEC